MINGMRILIITTVYMYSQEPADIDSQSVIESSWCENLPRAVYADLERIQVSNTWFEVYRLDHDVFAIYEPYQWQEVISYLILGRKKALLFDTGNGIGSIRDLVNELKVSDDIVSQ